MTTHPDMPILPPDSSNAALQQEVAALREQLHIYKQILDAVPTLIFYKGRDSTFHYVNDSFHAYTGTSLAELQGRTHAGNEDPAIIDTYIAADQQVFTSAEAIDIPAEPMHRHDGAIEYFHTIKKPLYDLQGAVVGLVGISENINAQHLLNQTIAQQQARVERMIANAPGMVFQFLLGTDGTASFPFVSQGSQEIYGLEPQAIMDDVNLVLDPVHPDDRASFESSIATSAATLEPWRWEGRVQTQGGIKWLQGISRPSRLADGATLWDGLLIDVTLQRQALEARERFEAILAATPDLVAIADVRGSTLYLNPAGRTMLEIDAAADLTQQPVLSFFPQHVAQQLEQEAVPIAVKEGRWSGESTILTTSGGEIPVSQVLLCHFGANGKLAYFSTIVRDIRDQKAAEAEQQRLQAAIIQAQAQALIELSSPLIPLTTNVVLLPLIGSIDSQRAQQVMETLLQGVAANQSQIAILDVSGVPIIDTHVAGLLLRAAASVRLLGAEVLITGIRPEIAQTLVGLGISLEGLQAYGSLQQGIAYAFSRQSR